MAWITKNSASATVARRSEPYLTPKMQERLRREILPRYETTLGALLPTLHEVQHAHGWLPPQAMLEIAEFLKIKPADVIDTVTFYEEYWTKPKGKYLIQICRSIACECLGHEQLTAAVRSKLGIDVGETTDDGLFTLIELECLGSCGTAPAVLFNEKLEECATPQRMGEVIDAIRAGKYDDGTGGHH